MEPRTERGSYTAELAVALPSLLLVLACALLGVGVADASLRCQDAARSGARALARGEPRNAVVAAGAEAAPADAQIDVIPSSGMAEVRCAARVRMFGLHTFTVRSRAVAPMEDPNVPGLPGADLADHDVEDRP